MSQAKQTALQQVNNGVKKSAQTTNNR